MQLEKQFYVSRLHGEKIYKNLVRTATLDLFACLKFRSENFEPCVNKDVLTSFPCLNIGP